MMENERAYMTIILLFKQDGEETRSYKLKKSTTFRASPLPSFYHKKDPLPKPELKKVRRYGGIFTTLYIVLIIVVKSCYID